MIPESSVLAECVLLRGRRENDGSGHHDVETAVVGNRLSSVFHRKIQSRNGLAVGSLLLALPGDLASPFLGSQSALELFQRIG